MYRGLAVYGHEFGSGAGLRAGSGGKVLDPNRIIRLGRTNISPFYHEQILPML
jgi:hypothetical protein